MVATERMKRADTEEELKEARQEKEALRSALRILEGENVHLRGSSAETSPVIPFVGPSTTSPSPSPTEHKTHLRRTSSQLALKSPPATPTTVATSQSTPESPTVSLSKPHPPSSLPLTSPDAGDEADSQKTPQFRRTRSRPPSLQLDEHDASPWADVPSRSDAYVKTSVDEPSAVVLTVPDLGSSSLFAAAAQHSMR